MAVMNVQSSKSLVDASNLYFYAIPADWMRRSWPLLHGRFNDVSLGITWREKLVGQIMNASLLEQILQQQPIACQPNAAGVNSLLERTPNPQDPEASTIEKLQSHILHKTNQHALIQKRIAAKLRRNAQLNKDYFLVGSNVWLLLKLKFGYDHEIRLRCQFIPVDRIAKDLESDSFSSPQSSCLAVVVDSSDNDEVQPDDVVSPLVDPRRSINNPQLKYIPIPPTGRFRYEDHLEHGNRLPNQRNDTSSKIVFNPDEVTNRTARRRSLNESERSDGMHDSSHPGVSNGNNISDDDDDDDDYHYKTRHESDDSPDDTVRVFVLLVCVRVFFSIVV